MINFLSLSSFLSLLISVAIGSSVWGILSLPSSYLSFILLFMGSILSLFSLLPFIMVPTSFSFSLFLVMSAFSIFLVMPAFSIFLSLSRSLSVSLSIPISMPMLPISVSILVFSSNFLISLTFLFPIFKLN